MKQSMVLKAFIILVGLAAIGGAVVWGVAQSAEVRGDSAVLDAGPETTVGEPVARAGGVPEVLALTAGAVPSAQDLADYLSQLRAEDYARYTHPRYGFSFTYPKEFVLGTAVWGEEDVTDLWLGRYRLAMRVTVRPIEGSQEILADLASVPADFDAEPPEGADGGAVAWLAEDDPYPGKHTYAMWFAHKDHLYHIQLHAPHIDVLDVWARGVMYSNFRLTRPSHDS